MIDITGHSISKLPIGVVKKVSDLMFYEGPILSHFVDAKGGNFLYYWVDYDNSFNRWLIWKVNDEQLYNFIKGFSDFRELFSAKNKDFIYSVDIDSEMAHHNIRAIELEDVVPDYIPEENCYFDECLIPEYEALLEKFESNMYLALLKKKALYFTLEPKERIFSTTVGAIEAGNFLKKISGSFLKYMEFDLYESFKNKIPDVNRLAKITSQFKTILEPRVVDLQYSSFKVALSTDTIKKVESKGFQKWQKSILDKYKDNVIEVDYNSEETMKKLADTFPNQVIKDVHMPIVDIINNKKYKTSVRDNSRRYRRTFSEVSAKNIEILKPKVEQQTEVDQKRKIVSLLVEINEKEDIQRIGKKELQSGLLFTQVVKKYPIPLSNLKYENTQIILKRPIICELYIEDNITFVTCNEIKITVSSKLGTDILNRFNARFIEMYFALQHSEAEEDEVLRSLWNSLVERVEKD